MTSHVLLVAGAVSYDYLVYSMTASNDTSSGPQQHSNSDHAQIVIRTGQADLVAQLLTAAAPQWGFEVLGPTLPSPGSHCLKNNASTLLELSCTRSALNQQPNFSITRLRHVGKPPVWHSPPTGQATKASASTVVITGSGDSFVDIEPAIDLLQRVRPKYVVHHMTRPLATGKLWDVIRHGPMTSNGVPEPDNLVVIIDAEDLCAEGITLSRSLSWEATSEDFVRNLGSNGRLDTLVTCPNLIVRFGKEGVIHHRGRDAADPKLYFNPRATEANNQADLAFDTVAGTAAFTAGFALGFADSTPPSPVRGIQTGIKATDRLAKRGFVQDPVDGGPAFPVDEVMGSLMAESGFTATNIPSARISSGDEWNLFDALTGDPAEVARQIVISGPERALGHCSIRCFGKYRSFERAEQESLGAVLETTNERLQSTDAAPICIGLLGPVGSGKKFVASSLAEHLSNERATHKLLFNARTLKQEDLIAACHTIRDHAAAETLPVVIFENFNAVLEPNNPLLNEFISTAQNGTFNDTGHVRKLGHCLMFFLVDQDSSDSDSAPTPTATEFALRRRPTTPLGNDFNKLQIDDSPLLDSLHGIVRLPGPNQTSSTDRMFAVRRAMMLRQLLLQNHPHLSRNGTIEIDDAVLHALLLTPSFKHGLRSLEKIISTSRLSNRTRFDVSALPPEEQIQLHVDGRTFMAYLRAPKLPPALRERLAQGLFEAYKKQRELMAKTPAERKALESDRSYCDWEDLAGELKESTRAQADDIPRKLRAVGCFMLNDETRGDPLVHVPRFGDEELLMLSEMEHERFNAERLQRQWRMGPRNAKQRTTPFLVPWRDLTQEWKDVDTVMVECVPGILETAGYRIYRMKGDSKTA